MLQIQTKQGANDVTGVEVEYDPIDMPGVVFVIARSGNSQFLKAYDACEAPYRRKIQKGKLKTAENLDIQCRAMAQGILKGWSGVQANGEDFPYSLDNAYTLLRHNADIREWVMEQAANEQNFREEAIEEDAKK